MTQTAIRSSIDNAAGGRTVTANDSGEYLGDLVAWDIADNDGFSASRNVVRELFEKNGFFGYVEDAIDPGKAIKKAMKIVPCGSQLVVKAMAKHKKDTTIAVAVYRKYSVEGEKGDKWIAGARVRVDITGRWAVALPMEGEQDADVLCEQVANRIARKANELVNCVTNRELSVALGEVGRRGCYWATYRRKMGGVWFVLSQFADSFRSLLKGLEAIGGFMPIIQPLYVDAAGHTAKNVEYAAEGVLEAELSRLTKDLNSALNDGKMRESTVEKRIAELDDVMARVELYSSLLSGKAKQFIDQATKVQKNFRAVLEADGLIEATPVKPVAVTDVNDLGRFDL